MLPPRVIQIFLAGFAVLWLSAILNAGTRPNIVLIMADDMGYECVSSYGAADYWTPHLDRLASEGVRFTQAHSQPLCTPTRVQLMTGQSNVRNYVGFGVLDPAQRTFGNDLREAGYTTAIAGKWQLGKDRALIDHFGFDEYCLWWLERKSWRYGDVGELIVNGEVRPGDQGEYGPDVVNDFVLDFIERQADGDAPFFVYYPMMLPHAPFVPTPLSAGSPDPREQDPRFFHDMVAYTDRLVGRVAAKLDELRLRENTLLIFLGDNGTNHAITSHLIDGREIKGGKSDTTDAGTHVPMIVSWPGTVPMGLVSEGLVDFADFLTTFHAMAGYSPASNRPLDGVNLLPVFRGERPTTREWIYSWYMRGNDTNMVSDEDVSVFVSARTARYKLYRDGGFYDVARDPREQDPLDGDSLEADAAAVRAQLAEVIAGYDAVEAGR